MKLSEFNVIVQGNISCDVPITEHRAYSYEEALNTAHELSGRYPDSQIVIDEWQLVQSPRFLKSWFYRGRRIYYSPEAA